jgi:malate dehydrogenase (oxaloacetate-decarboxylating)
VVTLAALINAARVTGRQLKDLKVVFSGAGAAGIATARLLYEAGARDLLLVDSKGVVHAGRTDLTPVKKGMLGIANKDGVSGSLADALVGADVSIGVSMAGIVKPEMVRAMAADSIVLPMANPVPEIMPDLAKEAGAAIVGTGRSDFPNQINNVLAFPGIFRGALDARASYHHGNEAGGGRGARGASNRPVGRANPRLGAGRKSRTGSGGCGETGEPTVLN